MISLSPTLLNEIDGTVDFALLDIVSLVVAFQAAVLVVYQCPVMSRGVLFCVRLKRQREPGQAMSGSDDHRGLFLGLYSAETEQGIHDVQGVR